MRAFAITTCDFKQPTKWEYQGFVFSPPIAIWVWKQYSKKRVLKDSFEYQSGIYRLLHNLLNLLAEITSRKLNFGLVTHAWRHSVIESTTPVAVDFEISILQMVRPKSALKYGF